MPVKFALLCLLFYTLVQSRVTEQASLFVDMVPSSVNSDNTYFDTVTDQNFTFAIRIKNYTSVKSFSVRIEFDPQKISYIECTDATSNEKNVIDGGMFFDYKDGSIVEFVGSMQNGNNSTVNNNPGLLAVFTFKSRLGVGESALIKIKDALIITGDNETIFFEGDSNTLSNGLYGVHKSGQTMYIIDVQQSEYGTILPVGPIGLKEGENSPIFTFTPDSNAVFEWAIIDSINKNIKDGFMFEHINANHTISAKFKSTTSIVKDKVTKNNSIESYISFEGSRITFSELAKNVNVEISICDMMGKMVRKKERAAYFNSISFDQLTKELSPGFYCCVIMINTDKITIPLAVF